MSAQPWDVAVVGGGPAGCSAAITLASAGLQVILFEAKAYPHDKLCGEFLSPECAGLIHSLGAGGRLEALQPVQIHTASLTSVDGSVWESPLPGTALGISRSRLDMALADRAREAGVMVCESSQVSSIDGSFDEGFTLETTGRRLEPTVPARAVIAAHGKRAALDRTLNRPFLSRYHPYIAMKAHFYGPPIPGRMELHAFPGGYCGISDIEGDRRVLCLLAHEKAIAPFRAKGEQHGGSILDRFLDWVQTQNLYLRSWLQWSERIHERWITIAQVPFSSKRAIERDVLMAGDAAGLMPPLAGDGIAMALESGRLAGRYVQRWLNKEMTTGDLRRAYPSVWQSQFGGRHRLGRMLQPLLLNPRAASMALRLMNRFPQFGRFLIKNTRGIEEYVYP